MNKFSEEFMEIARQSLYLEDDDTSRDNEINAMTKLEMLDTLFNWEGIINYTGTVVSWIYDLFGIDLTDMNE